MTEFLDSLNFLWELFKRDLKKKYYDRNTTGRNTSFLFELL